MSFSDARAPSFVTSVLESSFSIRPSSESVFVDRSMRSTRPATWACSLPEDAVAPALPVCAEPLVSAVEPEAWLVSAALPDVPLPPGEPRPMDPWVESPVLLCELLPLVVDGPAPVPPAPIPPLPEPEPCASARPPANASNPAASATHLMFLM
jgi:hypothetical protein